MQVLKRFTLASCCLAWGIGSATAQEAFSHAATGFSVVSPPGFIVRNERSDPNHEVLVDIASLTNQPPIAGSSNAVCAAGFRQTPEGVTLTQAELSEPSALEARVAEAKGIFEGIGLAIDSIQPVENTDAAAFEMLARPTFGPDHENASLYFAIMDRPAGRVDVVCATTTAAMREALPVFQTIRDGVTVKR